MFPLVTSVTVPFLLVCLAVSVPSTFSQPGEERLGTADTRWGGIRPGPYAVGFELRTGLDRSRRINESDEGTRVGLAIWYPAHGAAGQPAMTSFDYRLLVSSRPPTESERQALEDGEVGALLAWRHVGIVALSAEQAKASLHTRGIAVSRAPAVAGRFPVVMVLGGR